MRQRLFITLFVSLAVVLTGCIGLAADTPSATPAPTTTIETPTTDPVTVEPTETVTFQVTAASEVRVAGSVMLPENDGVRIHYGTSSVTYPGVLSADALPAGALDGATGVEPILEGDSVEFVVSDGTGGGAVEWAGHPSEIFISVVDSDGSVLQWNVLDCEGLVITDVTLTVHSSGTVSHAKGCSAFSDE